jgi:hypothetical protein
MNNVRATMKKLLFKSCLGQLDSDYEFIDVKYVKNV